jgi:uncharacterized membrane protein (UPF0127 family)
MVNRYWITTLLVLASGLLVGGCEYGDRPAAELETIDAVIAEQAFVLELALDGDARFAGLSDRTGLDVDQGMLFVFPDPVKTKFVMRRCLFPIDLVYLGAGGRIDRMHRMTVEPYETPEGKLRRYASSGRVQFVLEFASGTIDRLGLKPGQKIALPLESLKQRAR